MARPDMPGRGMMGWGHERWGRGGPGAQGNWGDMHRFALVLGGVVAWMLGGFVVFKVAGALRIDWIGKGVLNAAAAIWLFSLWPLGGRRS